jgi:4-hydroxy-tetrahydrodipicolinate synthase
VKTGVTAIAHPMHIAEAPNLTDPERRKLAGILVQSVAGRVPTFVHVSAAGTGVSAELARHCAGVGSTGIVLLAPYYWRSEEKDLVRHFVDVAQAHGGKLIAYNNAAATNVVITPGVVRKLLEEIPGFAGIKDASFHMETFTDYCHTVAEAGRDVAVYTGIERLSTSVPAGGSGCFSACGEVAPRLIRALFDACVENRMEDARRLQSTTSRLLARLRTPAFSVGVKYAMEVFGRPVGEVRRPLPSLSEDEKRVFRKDLASLGILESEPHGWDLQEDTAPRRVAAHG